jgi:hypothetical protein
MSLNSLKQTTKQWHKKFDKVILLNKFKINEVNKCVYVKNRKWIYQYMSFY